MKDALKSALDNLKERTTNPFLGTLVLVWLFHNWKLIYSLFYFSPELTLKDRIIELEKHFQRPNADFYGNLCHVVLITFIVLIITYVLLIFARLFTDLYDKIALPHIARLTDKSSIVLRSEYDELKEVVKQLELRLEEERLAKVAVQNERDMIDKKLYEHLNPTTTKAQDTREQQFERVRVRFEQEDIIEKISSSLKSIQTAKKLSKNNNAMLALLNEGLIEVKQNDPNSSSMAIFAFTDEGREFLRYWNGFYDNPNS